MRRGLLLAALLAAQPALAGPYDNSRFAQRCREKAPGATCQCVVSRLAQTPDGRFGMEVQEVVQTQAGDNLRRGLLDLLKRYNMRPSDAEAAMARMERMLEPMIRACL